MDDCRAKNISIRRYQMKRNCNSEVEGDGKKYWNLVSKNERLKGGSVQIGLTIQFKHFALVFSEQQFQKTDKKFLNFRQRVISDFS